MIIYRGRLIVALIALISLYAILWYIRTPDMPAGVTVDATPAPELRREETVPVIIDFAKVYKPVVKRKLALPQAVQQDEAKHVVASTKTPNDERSHTVTTVIDSGTGEFTSYDRVEPHPWVAVSTRTQIGIFYGWKGGEQIARLQAQQELLQIKAVRLGAAATLDSDGETFVGVGAWVRW